MLVFRICLAKWSHRLTASGFGVRWNSKGRFVIYTASSRSLACLENLVHRSGEGLNESFKLLTIEIPKTLKIHEVKLKELSKNWSDFNNSNYCKKIGDMWLDKHESAVMKVPSAIIPDENNYLINPNHNDFKKISLAKIENFTFDPRI